MSDGAPAVRALVVEGETRFSVALSAVRAVVAHPALTPVPTAPPSVLGLANVRGDVVPVFDAGLLLDGGPTPDPAFVVIVETARGPAGLAVAVMPLSATVAADTVVDPEALVPR